MLLPWLPLPPASPPRRYGLLMLGVEILGGVAVLPYALCLTMRVVENKAPPPDERTGLNSTKVRAGLVYTKSHTLRGLGGGS